MLDYLQRRILGGLCKVRDDIQPPVNVSGTDIDEFTVKQINRLIELNIPDWKGCSRGVCEAKFTGVLRSGWGSYRCTMRIDDEGDEITEVFYIKTTRLSCRPLSSPLIMCSWDYHNSGMSSAYVIEEVKEQQIAA